jgi:hypothetical protein
MTNQREDVSPSRHISQGLELLSTLHLDHEKQCRTQPEKLSLARPLSAGMRERT